MAATFTREKAVWMVSRMYEIFQSDRISKNQFKTFLLNEGLGTSPKSVNSYLDLLQVLGLIDVDPYGAGLITLNKEIASQPRDTGLTKFL